jgi:hypothetical protein
MSESTSIHGDIGVYEDLFVFSAQSQWMSGLVFW